VIRELDIQMAEDMAVMTCTKSPASVLKKRLMVCASSDILFFRWWYGIKPASC